MTKRQAIVAAMGGVIGLMSNRAKADSITSVPSVTITVPTQSVAFSFDTFQSFTFTSKGKSVTLSGDEIFAALSQQ